VKEQRNLPIEVLTPPTSERARATAT